MRSNASNRKRKVPKFVKYLRAIGGVGLLVGGSGVMWTSPKLFWYAAAFLYVGFLVLLIDGFREPNIGQLTRWAWLIAIVGVALAFSLGIVLYPATLKITATCYEGKYKQGENIYGIEWDEGMSDLRVDIHNPTDRDYDHLDVVVIPEGVLIRDQKQVTNIPGVSVLPVAHEVHLKYVDKSGALTSETNESNIPHDGVRVFCDRLPKKTTIGLILATSNQNPRIEGSTSKENGIHVGFVDPASPFLIWVRARANSVRTVGEFSVLNRPFKSERSYPVSQQ
jgi:hypothetical protein